MVAMPAVRWWGIAVLFIMVKGLVFEGAIPVTSEWM